MRKDIPDLYFEKVKNGTVTESDRREFTDWLGSAGEEQVNEVLDQYREYFEGLPYKKAGDPSYIRAIESGLDLLTKDKKTVFFDGFLKTFLSVAAALVVAFLLFLQYNRLDHDNQPVSNRRLNAQIVPGSNKATLTLSNGRVIDLDASKNGTIAKQGDVTVSKSAGGQLVYGPKENDSSKDRGYGLNMVSTPLGGQYAVTLPDGSKVWLNAVSTLRFPAHFTGPDRRVELTGEAYFEVAKDKQHPFRVSVNNSEVEVLGTHFNIMGYSDEGKTVTSLLEGSVKVKRGALTRVIKPGEQAKVGEDIQVAAGDVSASVEWKNGNFNFDNEQLPVIMRKIARWYNIQVDYSGKVTTEKFIGTIPRTSNINDVLTYLEKTDVVHFKIQERRVVVMP